MDARFWALFGLLATVAGCSDNADTADLNAPCNRDHAFTNDTGWYDLRVASKDPIGIDGRVVLYGSVKGSEDPAVTSALHVTVADWQGIPVPGNVEQSADFGPTRFRASAHDIAWAWVPSAAMTEGSYSVALAIDAAYAIAAPESSGDGIQISSSTSPLAPVTVASTSFASIPEPSGDLHVCLGMSGWGCTNQPVSGEYFPSSEVLPGIVVAWQSSDPSANRMVELEAIAGKGTFSSKPWPVHEDPNRSTNQYPLSATFSDQPAEYCVRVVSTDLRTLAQTKSDPICVATTNPVVLSPDSSRIWDCK